MIDDKVIVLTKEEGQTDKQVENNRAPSRFAGRVLILVHHLTSENKNFILC